MFQSHLCNKQNSAPDEALFLYFWWKEWTWGLWNEINMNNYAFECIHWTRVCISTLGPKFSSGENYFRVILFTRGTHVLITTVLVIAFIMLMLFVNIVHPFKNQLNSRRISRKLNHESIEYRYSSSTLLTARDLVATEH